MFISFFFFFLGFLFWVSDARGGCDGFFVVICLKDLCGGQWVVMGGGCGGWLVFFFFFFKSRSEHFQNVTKHRKKTIFSEIIYI